MVPLGRAVNYTGREAFPGGNNMTLETMIDTLSRDEKLAAMDLIWRDLAAGAQAFVSPEWHEAIIADRHLVKYNAVRMNKDKARYARLSCAKYAEMKTCGAR